MPRKKKIGPELPENGRGTWKHPDVPGLELRGNSKGGSWTLRHRVEGQRVRDALGRWPGLGPDEAAEVARARLQAVATQAAAGGDVLGERKAKAAEIRRRRLAPTLGKALDDYAADRLAHLKSGDHAEKVLRNVFGPVLDRSMSDLDRPTLLAPVEAKRRTAAATADLAVRYGKPWLKWIAETGRGEDLLSGVRTKQTRQRDRLLTLGEVGAVWNALHGDSIAALCTRALMATAQRRDEVSEMRREEIDLDRQLWTIPASRMKSGKDHLVPLNRLACDAIATAMGAHEHDLVFAGRMGSTPFSGWSRWKTNLDRTSGVTGWVLHDFRRAFVSHVAERGVDAVIADRCLAHAGSGTLSQVARVYQRSAFLEQRAEAMDIWATTISEAATRAAAGNVLELRA